MRRERESLLRRRELVSGSFLDGLAGAGTQEQVWNHVKSNGVGRKTIFVPDQMKATIIGVLRSL